MLRRCPRGSASSSDRRGCSLDRILPAACGRPVTAPSGELPPRRPPGHDRHQGRPPALARSSMPMPSPAGRVDHAPDGFDIRPIATILTRVARRGIKRCCRSFGRLGLAVKLNRGWIALCRSEPGSPRVRGVAGTRSRELGPLTAGAVGPSDLPPEQPDLTTGRGPRAPERGHDLVPGDGAAARRHAQAVGAADGDADQQRALGSLQPRDAVRPT